MKKFKKFLLLLCLIPCVFLFNACSFFNEEEVYVTNIVQTEVVGNVATYTIYYSDGTTSLFTITNGKDGVDGKDGENGKDGADADFLTIQSIKDYCEQNNLDFEEFLAEYLTINEINNNINIESVQNVQEATNVAIHSAVTIWCEFPNKDYNNNKKTSLACGAGVIYEMEEGSEYSYIVTNYHVVYYPSCATSNHIAKRINIFQYGGDETVYKNNLVDNEGYPTYVYGHGAIEAEYVGGSLNYDLAVLKVKTEDLLTYNENAKPVTIAEEYNLGEAAIAIGNPECEGFSVTNGIISVVSEDIDMEGADDVTKCNFRVMRIDTAVNGGNSGGGLFNMNGELIGIVNAKAVSSDIDNIAYALPVDNVTKVVNNLIYYYEKTGTHSQVKKLFLDIEYTTENSRSVYNPTTNRTTITDDLKVADVTLGGLGYLIGLKEDDVIQSIIINGTKHTITRSYQLPDLLLNVRAGDNIILTVKRGNVSQELGVAELTGVSPTHFETVK